MTFTSDKTYMRDGYVVAFEGEVMTEDEARRRGLVAEIPAEPEQVEELETVKPQEAETKPAKKTSTKTSKAK